MADYPCDYHLARYQGAATRLYLNIFKDDQVASMRYSICGDCLAEVMEQWLGRALHQTPEGYWDPPVDGESLESLMYAPAASRNGTKGYARR